MRPLLDLRSILPVMLAALAMASTTASAQGAATSYSDCVAAAGPDRSPSVDSAQLRSSAPTAAADTTHAAIRLLASVQASEVTFAREPKICVRLNGDARLDSVRVVGRRNLTSPVVSGTTYRDVYVAVEILGHLNAECIAARITRSAAGAAGTDSCASLSVRDSSATAARPKGAVPP